MKKFISYALAFVLMISNFAFAPEMLVTANANDEAYYESVLTANDTYFINPAWDTENLAEGTDITIWFRGKERTLKFDKSKHFASYADLYTAVYENDTVVNLTNYATFIPTFIFAPGTYSEYIHIPSQATILGAQAGISPNENLTDAQKTLDYVEANNGWAKNPDRLGTENETVFTGYVHYSNRDYNSSANAEYSYTLNNYAYKYAYLLDKAYADNSNFVYTQKIDGVVIGTSGRSGPVSFSNVNSGQSLTWQADNPITSIKYKAIKLDLVNTISKSTDLLVMSWDSSYSDIRINVQNLRSEQSHASNSYELFRGYLGALSIKNSYIANAPGKITRSFGEYIVQRVPSQTVEITGNIFYNNDTSIGHTDGTGEFLCFDSRSAAPVTATITKNVFYNAHNSSTGLLRFRNQNKNGSLTVDFCDNIIHHSRNDQTTLISLADVIGKTSKLTFNRNRITGVITKLVSDNTAITGTYNFNFNENFLGATKTSEGVKPEFNVNGTSQDANFSWGAPTYYTDYAMTRLVNPNATGITFDEYSNIVTRKKLPSVPYTYEAWINIPSSVTGNAGKIVSNDSTPGTYVSFFDFDVQNGSPRIRWFDSMGVQSETAFANVKVNTGEWTHVAITFDGQNGIAKCYVNGEYAASRYYYTDLDPQIILTPIVIGSDHLRNAKDSYFKGKLKSVELYSDVRTAEEIKADYENGVNLSDEGLIASYDLSLKSETGLYLDASSNVAHAVDGKFWMTEDEMDVVRSNVFDKDFERAYNLVVVGDTQMTTREDNNNDANGLDTLYKYIVDNIETNNSQYVIGVGDITDNNSVEHWEIAKSAITQMDGKIGYSLIRGNHDVDTDTNYIAQNGTKFNQYFANHTPYTSQFTGEKGGVYEQNSVHNTWTTFKMGTVDYLVINIDWHMSDGVLEWAKGVVESHPDHRVIISTHSYLNNDGTHINDNFKIGASGYGGATANEANNDGDDMWRKLVSQYENIELVFCGHVMSERIVVEQRKGVNGNTVTEVVVNQQGIDALANPQAGVGFVTNLFFNEAQDKIEVEVYSTVLDRYYRADNQFAIDLTVEGEEHTCNLSADKPEGQGTEQNPYLVSNGNHLLWIASKTVAGSSASLDGVYFKQTNDIDLRGQTIRPIGVYFNSDSDMQAFGGIYDGNGFTIKNGTVTASKANQADTRAYGYGLFGVIYGAEIKNVVLDNMTVMGRGLSGMLVGRAAAKLDGSSQLGFNKVSGCVIKDNCRLPVQSPAWRTPNPIFDTNTHTGVTGSFVGYAHATQISNCVSYLTMNLPAVFSTSGGIVGAIGYDSAVDSCIFAGTINVVDNASKCTTALGGIVGYISPTTQESVVGVTDAMRQKPLSITNCVNKGDINYTAAEAIPSNVNLVIGGILGSHSWQNDFDSQVQYKHLMENCYNLGSIIVGNVHDDATNIWVGGLVGKGLVTDGSSQITLYIKDSASIEVDARDNGQGVGTNEYRCENKTNTAGQLGVTVVDDTVTTKTAQQMDADVSEIENKLNKLLYKKAINLTTGNRYDTLAEALTSAEDGNTVMLLEDVNETMVSVLPGVTLDIGGHKLTARFVTGFEDSNIIDSNVTEDSGIYVERKYFVISENNSQLPIYDSENGCYMFTSVSLDYTYYEDSNYYFGPEPPALDTVEGARVNALLRENSENTGVQIIVHLDWETDDYYSTQDFTYKSNYVDEYFTMANSDGHYQNVYFYARFIGDALKQADTITVTTIVQSDRGAQFVSAPTEFSLK